MRGRTVSEKLGKIAREVRPDLVLERCETAKFTVCCCRVRSTSEVQLLYVHVRSSYSPTDAATKKCHGSFRGPLHPPGRSAANLPQALPHIPQRFLRKRPTSFYCSGRLPNRFSPSAPKSPLLLPLLSPLHRPPNLPVPRLSKHCNFSSSKSRPHPTLLKCLLMCTIIVTCRLLCRPRLASRHAWHPHRMRTPLSALFSPWLERVEHATVNFLRRTLYGWPFLQSQLHPHISKIRMIVSYYCRRRTESDGILMVIILSCRRPEKCRRPMNLVIEHLRRNCPELILNELPLVPSDRLID